MICEKKKDSISNNIWTLSSKIESISLAITYFPIIPIIIPQPVDLN